MRSISTSQGIILANGGARWVKVEIDRSGGGDWVDLTNLQGYNWLHSAEWGDNIDDPTATATVMLMRQQALLSLSPLMANSLLNQSGAIATVYLKMRISVALMPDGMAPASSDYFVAFFGRIYQVDWSDDHIKLEARDLGGDLADVFIETNSLFYGSSSGVLAETVMQSILTDQAANLPAAVTLYSITGTGGTPFQGADSPGWAIRTYRQDVMPIMSALTNIAQQIGWLLRYRWNASVGAFVLTWFDPVRGNTTPVHTFTASQYFKLTECGLHLGDIRNVVRVFYYASGNTSSQQVSPAPSVDAVSIGKYGRRYYQLAEEASSQINTDAEATTMQDRILSDLSQPLMAHAVEMPMFPFVELCDVYTFAANGVHYDSDELLSVLNFRHSIDATSAKTTITLRGKPSGGVKTWIDKQAALLRKVLGGSNVSLPDINANIPNSNFIMYSKG